MIKNIVIVLLLLVYCSTNILGKNSSNQITVSGISSGGFFAVQFHVAFSSIVEGAGIIAGGPYYCANGNVDTALSSCMVAPELISIDELIGATEYAADLLTIDATSNLQNSKVWLFSGTADTIVKSGVVLKLEEYYENYLTDPSTQIKTVYNYSAEHSYPTNNFGNSCDYLGPDYINNCNIDSAWEILTFLNDYTLSPPNSTFSSDNIIELDQSSFIPFGYSTTSAGLYSYAYAYVPTQCQRGTTQCSFHIVFHGCEQTIPMIGDTFYMNTGYNQIADTNNIIILYPQALATELNPKGCFDWWGFAGEDYASQDGAQMSTVKSMLDSLVSKYDFRI
ncbi:polyhydroxybutyrate depolymerase [Tieghemostelium lacteum]|uniref:Polyhydroxybutyrate depolymerase n=1 Tax=Tieghemostelium lacteum TaxID=361077 RepID=A0A152A610_TIELA|nr:polyhydroxybutyrate depolymerase [Tieghemostelium lacteum]|eukprot:KYR01545.1 polyhydroxybutyrate depolymerase [Tieghemostelium lacteum]